MVAAEAGDDVERRQLGRAVPLGISFGQDHRRAVLDRPVMERRELRAGQLDQLDPVGRLERPGRDDLVDLEGDRVPLLRIELGVHDRPVGVSFAVADLVRVGVEPDHGLDGISAGFEFVERAGEAVGTGSRSATARPASSSRRPRRKTAAAGTSSGPSRGSRRRLVRCRASHKPAP